MALAVVAGESRALGNNRAEVVVEGDGFEEVGSAAAKHLAIDHAARVLGISKAGIQGSGGPYPVGPGGELDPVEIARLPREGRKYRNKYPIQGGL